MTGGQKAGGKPPVSPMTETILAEILSRHYLARSNAEIPLPTPVEWTLTAAAIRNFQREPWSNHDAGVLTAAVRQMQRERATLAAAAKILEADAARFFQGNEEWQRRYAEAIAMLRRQRGASDNRFDHVSKITGQGPSITGWAFTARQILTWLVPILMRYSVPVSSRRTSPLVKSLLEILGFIYPPHKMPAASTLSDVVKEYLDNRTPFSKARR
jgi:hypothetical protein